MGAASRGAAAKAPKPSVGHDAKSTRARFERIARAWQQHRSQARPGDVRVFDLTITGIRSLLDSGSEADLAEARESLNEFVANALGGDEP